MNLNDFFLKYNKVALAFSGGVDSAYLLYYAKKYGADIKAYYVKSDFQPEFELNDAKKMANQLKADLSIINLDILKHDNICKNPKNRCYYCKKQIFNAIVKSALNDGYNVIIDGTNASDDAEERAGMKVLKELNVLSPLRLCGLTKEQIREKSKEANLFIFDKPAYSCLATRIKTGEYITKDKLKTTEYAESVLFDLGFTDFRVRMFENNAKIQLKENQLALFTYKRAEILEKLKNLYDNILLDLEVR